MKTMITNINQLDEPYNWIQISRYQELSEPFIREFKDNVNWNYIFMYQDLSEPFIREFKDEVNWYNISRFQVLSEDFIREFKDYVDWDYVSTYQNLSEDFICEFKDVVNWKYISQYQDLSKAFINAFHIEISPDNWNYVSNDVKVKALDEIGLYEIKDGYLYGYKAVMSDMRSWYDSRLQYGVGGVFEARADANCDVQNSFGLSLWDKKGALNFYDKGLLLRVRARIEDVKALVHNGHKVRCNRLEILEVVK